MIRIFNTLTKHKQEFKPLEEGKVSIYLCGPTVYDRAHLGHGRSAVCFDLIRKYFEYKGFEVKYVSNYTDIDDKMINRAREEGITVKELADKVIPEYEEDYGKLGIKAPDVQPLATAHIDYIIDLITKLEAQGYIYVLDDGVYFDVMKFEDYGKLSGQSLEDLKMGARVEVNEKKRNPYDFALWKFRKPDEPSWESPWGEGRPGWHIECSAMSYKHLGRTFDIHGGGLDLVFPHHECEVAQSEAALGKNTFAKYWIHNGFINVDGEKMSKSLGNFSTLKEIFAQFDPQAVRLMFIQTHYRNPINFSQILLDQAVSALERLRGFIRNLDSMKNNDAGHVSESLLDLIKVLKERFESCMNDDFDTSGALGSVFEFVKSVNLLFIEYKPNLNDIEAILEILESIDTVFGIIFGKQEFIDDDIEDLIKKREEARANKDYMESDRIRDELKLRGIELEDSASGTIWKKI